MGTREPDEITSSVHDKWKGLRWSTEGERNGVCTIAVSEEWGCGGGCGFGVLEVASPD